MGSVDGSLTETSENATGHMYINLNTAEQHCVNKKNTFSPKTAKNTTLTSHESNIDSPRECHMEQN